MNQKELKKLSLLAEVACDYYERGLTQNEIADKLFLSRTRVSRLLKEAVDEGIVSFSVNYTFERHYEIEERLKNRFGLKHARVLNNRISEKSMYHRDVCKLGAEYLMEHMKKNLIIGTGWGDSLAILVKMLQPLDLNPDIVQLMGSVTCESISSTPTGCRNLSGRDVSRTCGFLKSAALYPQRLRAGMPFATTPTIL